jgi:hypothetical protein
MGAFAGGAHKRIDCFPDACVPEHGVMGEQNEKTFSTSTKHRQFLASFVNSASGFFNVYLNVQDHLLVTLGTIDTSN